MNPEPTVIATVFEILFQVLLFLLINGLFIFFLCFIDALWKMGGKSSDFRNRRTPPFVPPS